MPFNAVIAPFLAVESGVPFLVVVLMVDGVLGTSSALESSSALSSSSSVASDASDSPSLWLTILPYVPNAALPVPLLVCFPFAFAFRDGELGTVDIFALVAAAPRAVLLESIRAGPASSSSEPWKSYTLLVSAGNLFAGDRESPFTLLAPVLRLSSSESGTSRFLSTDVFPFRGDPFDETLGFCGSDSLTAAEDDFKEPGAVFLLAAEDDASRGFLFEVLQR